MWGVGGAEYNSRILRSAIVFKRQTLLHPEESSGSEQWIPKNLFSLITAWLVNFSKWFIFFYPLLDVKNNACWIYFTKLFQSRVK